jgi:hypothetical protein
MFTAGHFQPAASHPFNPSIRTGAKEPLEDNLLWMTFKFFAFRRRSCSVIEDGEDR